MCSALCALCALCVLCALCAFFTALCALSTFIVATLQHGCASTRYNFVIHKKMSVLNHCAFSIVTVVLIIFTFYVHLGTLLAQFFMLLIVTEL